MKWLWTFTFAMACIMQQAHAQQNVVVTPFEVMDTHPLCEGKGTIAYKVRFEAADMMARFGNLDAARPVVCSIRHRKGNQVQDIAIPCADRAEGDAAGAGAFALPEKVTVAAEFIGCIRIASHEVVQANWGVTSMTEFGNFGALGDLSDPTVSFVYSGPVYRSDAAEKGKVLVQPTWAMIFRDTVTKGGLRPDDSLPLTSYVILSPEPLMEHACLTRSNPPVDCEPRPMTVWGMRNAFRSQEFRDAVGFVTGEKW